jgi:outer membrane protein W
MIDSTSSDNFDYDLKFVYLQMPVYVSYSFLGADSKLQPKVYAGVSFSARIKANLNTKFERTVGDSIAASRETDDETVAYKYSPVDVGALGGLAVDYWLTDKMFLGLDFRYTTSLFDLSENETNRKENAIKTNQIGAFLTFGFRCGKK